MITLTITTRKLLLFSQEIKVLNSKEKDGKMPSPKTRKPKKNPLQPMKQSHKTLALWLVLLLMFAVIYQVFHQEGPGDNTIRYSDFIAEVKAGKIATVTVNKDDRIDGTYKVPINDKKEFTTTGNASDSNLPILLEKHQISWEFKKAKKTPFWQQALLSWFPILLLVFLFIFFMRQLQLGGGKAMSFGKSRARLLNENSKKITFKDVAGIKEAKEELMEIIEFLKDRKKFTRLGGRIPKGVLLIGAPGTGKTLLARAIAGEAKVPFFSIAGSDFVEMFVGVGASRVRDLFEQGKRQAPCIIFIDEIDAVGRQRGAGIGGGHDEREQTLNQLLVEMDGFESNEGVILVAATNRPDVLDVALLRPGRFDRRVVVNKPDVRGREAILNVHTKRTVVKKGVDLNIIARGTPGFSGADLENLVNEAALMAARKNKKHLEMEDFEEAKDKVLMGAERKSMIISDEEKRNTAYHESGHTIVGWNLPGTDPIHKVTIIPRGMALGLTQTLPNEDHLSYSRGRTENMICFLMGGRAAEEIIFDHKTTGAGNDIERATDLAKKMVCEWGMSERLGPISLGKKREEIFIGREINQAASYSEKTAQLIDQEIREIMELNYRRAKDLLLSSVDILHAMANALLEYEVLDKNQIQKLMNGEKLSPKAEDPGSSNVPDNAESSTDSNKGGVQGQSLAGTSPVTV